MSQVFKDFDLSSVWEANSWADENYKEAPFTPEILAAVESELGYKLPQSFIELMAVQNGGIFVKKLLSNHAEKFVGKRSCANLRGIGNRF